MAVSIGVLSIFDALGKIIGYEDHRVILGTFFL